MARTFASASSQYLDGGTNITATPLTVALWAYYDTTSNYHEDVLLSIMDDGATGQGAGFSITADSRDRSSAGWCVVYTHASWGIRTAYADLGGDITGAWHHYGGVISGASSRIAYIDGNAGTEGTDSITPDSTPDSTVVAAKVINAAYSLHFEGSLAEVGVWNVALTAAELDILAKGYSPLFVRPQNLVFYVPLIRDNDDDIVGGLSLTASGSPTVGVHAPVFYPSVPILGKPSAEAEEEKLLQPMLIRSNQIPIHQLQL